MYALHRSVQVPGMAVLPVREGRLHRKFCGCALMPHSSFDSLGSVVPPPGDTSTFWIYLLFYFIFYFYFFLSNSCFAQKICFKFHLPMNMVSCSCGRKFNSEEALDQHQVTKGRVNGAAFTCKGPRTGRRFEAWLWKGVRKDPKPIQTIDLTNFKPLATAVSSASACELLCSYNWQNSKDARIQIPGKASWLSLSYLTFLTLKRDCTNMAGCPLAIDSPEG